MREARPDNREFLANSSVWAVISGLLRRTSAPAKFKNHRENQCSPPFSGLGRGAPARPAIRHSWHHAPRDGIRPPQVATVTRRISEARRHVLVVITLRVMKPARSVQGIPISALTPHRISSRRSKRTVTKKSRRRALVVITLRVMKPARQFPRTRCFQAILTHISSRRSERTTTKKARRHVLVVITLERDETRAERPRNPHFCANSALDFLSAEREDYIKKSPTPRQTL